MAKNPDKLWTDENGNQRKLNVKSYYVMTQNLVKLEELQSKIGSKKQHYQAPITREISQEKFIQLCQKLNKGQSI